MARAQGPLTTPGFVADDAPIVDFILRCTHRIWEEKAIGLIYTHYAHNTPVHRSDAEWYGRDQVVADTVRTLAAFPDLRLFCDEVIWCGNGQDGFYTSHRVTWSGHHLGHGDYGPPGGRRVQCRVISQCCVRENRILEEWIVRDEAALLLQLGLDPIETARLMAQQEAERGLHPSPHTHGEVPRLQGQLHPPLQLEGDPRDPADLPGLLYGLVWNARMLNHLRDYYAENAVVWVPGHRKLQGHLELTAYILHLLAAFPDGGVQLDHVSWLGSEAHGFRVAARWTFQGTHEGPGSYGPPTGKRVRVIGISHFEVSGGKIQREYMVWDEFALLKQLFGPN